MDEIPGTSLLKIRARIAGVGEWQAKTITTGGKLLQNFARQIKIIRAPAISEKWL